MVHGIGPDELVKLTPKLKPYLRRPDPTWADIIDAANWLRHAIVSTKEAEHFRTSPGGYFHGMVAKARAGELHLERTVWAMRRASEPEQRAGRGGDRVTRDADRAW